MLKSRGLTGALVVGAVAISSLFAAAPASAATLPAGQRIDFVEYYNQTMFNVDPATAAVTPLTPEGPVTEFVVEGVDVDDNGHGFAVGSGEGGGLIFVVDATTGALTDPTPVDINFEGGAIPSDWCEGIDYTGGVLIVVCYGEIEEDSTMFIGVATLPDGEGTWEVDPIVIDDDFQITAIATDPTTGFLYAFSGSNAMYRVTEDLGLTFLTNTTLVAFGADFDNSGQLWITTYQQVGEDPYAPALATVDLETGNFIDTQYYTLGGEVGEVDTESITVWGPPALPATGPADASLPLVGAAALLLFGTLLAGVTVLRRRRETS